MKNAVGDAAEAVGELLAPVVIKVASGIATLASGTGNLIDRIKDLAWEYMHDGKSTWQRKTYTQKWAKLTERFEKEAERIGGVDYYLGDSVA